MKALQKPQSKGGAIMLFLSVLVTFALLFAGFLLLRRVQKSFSAQAAAPAKAPAPSSSRSVLRASRAPGGSTRGS